MSSHTKKFNARVKCSLRLKNVINIIMYLLSNLEVYFNAKINLLGDLVTDNVNSLEKTIQI